MTSPLVISISIDEFFYKQKNQELTTDDKNQSRSFRKLSNFFSATDEMGQKWTNILSYSALVKQPSQYYMFVISCNLFSISKIVYVLLCQVSQLWLNLILSFWICFWSNFFNNHKSIVFVFLLE